RNRSLNCQETQQLVHAYLDGELDLVKSLEVEEHLQGCPTCAQTYEALAAVRATIKAGDLRFEPPPEFSSRIRFALRQAEGRVKMPRGPRRKGGVAAPVFFIALVGGWMTHPLTPST